MTSRRSSDDLPRFRRLRHSDRIVSSHWPRFLHSFHIFHFIHPSNNNNNNNNNRSRSRRSNRPPFTCLDRFRHPFISVSNWWLSLGSVVRHIAARWRRTLPAQSTRAELYWTALFQSGFLCYLGVYGFCPFLNSFYILFWK